MNSFNDIEAMKQKQKQIGNYSIELLRNKSRYICTAAESKQETRTCCAHRILVTNPFNLFNSYQKNQIFIALLVLFK